MEQSSNLDSGSPRQPGPERQARVASRAPLVAYSAERIGIRMSAEARATAE
jgi:hypothetical protein